MKDSELRPSYLFMKEYKKTVEFLTFHCQLQDIDWRLRYCFVVTRRHLDRKQRMLEVMDGNVASLQFYLRRKGRPITRRVVAQAMVSEYKTHIDAVGEQIYRLEKILLEHERCAVLQGELHYESK